MSASDVQFIGIKRITRDKDQKKVVRDETIRIKDIKSFRPWHKTEKDAEIPGDITLIVSDSIDQEEVTGKVDKVTTILISEGYKSFEERLGSVVVIR
jgi:hypothetical protein